MKIFKEFRFFVWPINRICPLPSQHRISSCARVCTNPDNAIMAHHNHPHPWMHRRKQQSWEHSWFGLVLPISRRCSVFFGPGLVEPSISPSRVVGLVDRVTQLAGDITTL
eukprot:2466762-Amphidinium_carterae.1